MGLGHYIGAANTLAEEIRDSLTTDEVRSLGSLLRALGLEGWQIWKGRHQATIQRFVAATPSERRKLKSLQPHRIPLAYAAYQHCMAAHAFLAAVDSNLVYPGPAYRSMAVAAGNAFLEVQACLEREILWPWDEPHPFAAGAP